MRLRRGKRSFRSGERRYDQKSEVRSQKSEKKIWRGDHARALGNFFVERAGDFVGARHRCAALDFGRQLANVESRSSGVFRGRSRVTSSGQSRIFKSEWGIRWQRKLSGASNRRGRSIGFELARGGGGPQ